MSAASIMRVGMHAVIHDINDWLDAHASDVVDARDLKAYLLATLILSNDVEDPHG